MRPENGYELFGTTLTVSPHKDADHQYGLGRLLSERYGVEFLPSDFKKKRDLNTRLKYRINSIYIDQNYYCRFWAEGKPSGE